MTRLARASSVLLVTLACFLHQAPTVTSQLASPEVKKISILDLFQEEPSLKAELEARLQEKKKIPAEEKPAAPAPKATTAAPVESPKPEEPPKPEQAPEAEEPAVEETASSPSNEPAETASQDRRRRPSRLASRGTARSATAADEPISDDTAAAAETEAVEKQEEPARRLRPHRLALRRNRPGLAAGSSPTTTTEGSEVPEPELEKELVDELNAAEVPQEAEGSTTTTVSPPGGRKLRARFSLPPRNGASATPSTPKERKEGTTATATAPAGGPASGLNRLRNARFGGSRTRNAGGAAGDKEAAPATPDDTASDAPAKKSTRLSLAERRSRFSNARTPPSKADAADETAADTDATATDAEDPEVTDSQSPRRNARRFPTLARRNS